MLISAASTRPRYWVTWPKACAAGGAVLGAVVFVRAYEAQSDTAAIVGAIMLYLGLALASLYLGL